VANTVCKKVQRKELAAGEGARLVAEMLRVPVEAVPCRSLAEDAYAVAQATGHSVYDCLYLALAVRLEAVMVSADARLVALVARVPALARHLRHVANLAEG